MIERVKTRDIPWDIIVIGGGATGIGCAVDAASRGYDVLLLEQNDFGKGASSRSTKLIHGGVRYLEQGDISLVREALKERGILLKNAPNIVEKIQFVVPCFGYWQKLYYGVGLKVYDFLSGEYSFGKSRILSKSETVEVLPNISQKHLVGGVSYFDGKFDDSKLLINLVRTASLQGAELINYCRVFGLLKNSDGKVCGIRFREVENVEEIEVYAKTVINAAGPFSDSIRRLSTDNAKDLIDASQGVHLVFDKSFLQNSTAIMIPKTTDGRVLFAIPFQGKTLVGTTDTPVDEIELEPIALETEIDFILETIQKYLTKAPTRNDILSVFAGIRPLVKSSETKNTAKLSRGHMIEIDEANLLTITGGKWTTYRAMAEDAIDQAQKIAQLGSARSVTRELKLLTDKQDSINLLIAENPKFAEKIHSEFEYQLAEVVFAVRHEMARTVEDVLARRTRILFLDAEAAIESAPRVAELLAVELAKDKNWIENQIDGFNKTASNYRLESRL